MSASKCIHALKVHPRIERALEYFCGVHHVWANPLGKCQLDISLSLSLILVPSLPPSLPLFLSPSLSQHPGRDCERLIRCETRCTFTSISHGTAKQLVQCKSPRARRRAGGIAIPNGKCRGSGILRLSSAEAALPIPDDSDSADYETQSLHVCGNSWHQTGHAR